MKTRILRLLIIFVAGMVGLTLIIFLATQYTSKPSFCSTCHYMEPYVEAWKTSSHANVTCIDCHFPPGLKSRLIGKFTAISMTVNYFTGVYKKSKPWAEITDNSCLRPECHETRLLEGRVLFKEGILFDHKPHLTKLRREKKLRCTSCHSQIVQGEHISVTESTCFLCHFKNQPDEIPIDNCTWCHSAPMASDSIGVKYDHSYVATHTIECQKCHGLMKVGDGTVPIERCSACHAELGKIQTYNDIEFIHKNHVTDHKVECQNCHQVILHKSVSKTPDIMPECQSCHIRPHAAQLNLFAGVGGKNVPGHPNPMFDKGLNCQGCHIFHQLGNGYAELGETVVARAEACNECHGEGYARILDQWENLMNNKINLLKGAFKTVEDEIESSNLLEEDKNLALALVDDARYNYQLVNEGNFVHNVAYSDELLFSAHNYLKRALDSISSKSILPDISIYSRLVPSECKNCHYGQEEIDVETFGITFSHNIHIERNHLLCSQCHSNMRSHGETVIQRSECLSCHHTQEELNCDRCHGLQAQIYNGSVDFAPEVMPDIMFEEGVECFSCHEGIIWPIEKASKERCTDCHDSEYEEILVEWQKETTASISQISRNLANLSYQSLGEGERLKVDEIKATLKLIENDKSQGVHNIQLTQQTLSEYSEFLQQLSRR